MRRKVAESAKWKKKKFMNENEISYKVIGAAIDLYKELGCGLLESAYENPLAYELRERGLFVEQQVPMPLIYKEIKMDCGYRLDLRVENKVIIRVHSKSISLFAP
jgi:GxxExxY protein